VALGDRIYHGEVGGAGIRNTIAQGVPNPKEFRSPMPAMGGAQLSAQQLRAVAAAPQQRPRSGRTVG